MQPNFKQPKFLKNLFPGNSTVKIFATEIHGESHPVSMHIPVTYLMTWYISCKFSHKRVVSKTT